LVRFLIVWDVRLHKNSKKNYSQTAYLENEGTRSFKTSGTNHVTTRCHIPEILTSSVINTFILPQSLEMFNDFTHRDHSTAAPNAKSQRFNLSEKQQSKQLTSEKKHRFSTMLNTVALNELMLPHTKLSPLLLGFVFYNSEFLQLLCTYLEPKYFPSLNVDHPNDRNNVTVFISVYTLPSVRAVLEG
jgi:hypothetical protein